MPDPETELTDSLQNIRHSLHELAQPLATVTGLVDLLMLEMDKNHELFQEVTMISQQLDKALAIIGEIRLMVQKASIDLVRESSQAPPP